MAIAAMDALSFSSRLLALASDELGTRQIDMVVRVHAVLGPDYCTPVRDVVIGHAPDGREWVEIIVGWEETEIVKEVR